MRTVVCIATLCIMMLFATAANAAKTQNDSTRNLKFSAFGIDLGYNGTYNNVQQSNGTLHSFGLSPTFGLHAIFNLKHRWQLETGLGFMEYDSKYIRYSRSVQSPSSADTVYFNDVLMTSAYYVTVPVEAKYTLSGRSGLVAGARFSGQIGNGFTPLSGYRAGNLVYAQTNPPGTLGSPTIATGKYDLGLILGYEYHFSDYLYASFLYNIGTLPLVSRATISGQTSESPSGPGNYFYPVSGNYNNSFSVRVCFNLVALDDDNFYIRGRHWHPRRFPSI